ncbi:MAG: AAA family ATPase [Thermodesulfobacteriota bacterium]
MKIIKLEAENVKRLQAIEITPEGSIVGIGGKNGAGKSSVLDSIMYALAGKAALPDSPIREGARSAIIKTDLGELRVARTITKNGGSLTVTNADGGRVSTPQTILNDLASKFTFDPLAFTNLAPSKQLETLKALVGVDFTDLDDKRQIAYEERTDYNREVKRLEDVIADLKPKIPAETPDNPIDILSIMQDLRSLEEKNRQTEKRNDRIHQVKKEIEFKLEELERLNQELDALQDELEEITTDPIKYEDLTTLTLQAQNAEKINAAVKSKQDLEKAKAELERCREEAMERTKIITEVDERKRSELAAAEFPVPGLGFDDDGILLNGLPFSQASSAEKLRVSVAMGIAMNPRLRVLLIRDGSLLDNESLAIIKEMAEKSDAQIWIERVGEGEECQVIIEDGSIKEAT